METIVGIIILFFFLKFVASTGKYRRLTMTCPNCKKGILMLDRLKSVPPQDVYYCSNEKCKQRHTVTKRRWFGKIRRK